MCPPSPYFPLRPSSSEYSGQSSGLPKGLEMEGVTAPPPATVWLRRCRPTMRVRLPKSTVGWRIEEEEEERGEAVRTHISRFLLAGRKRHIYARAGREPIQLFENRHYALKPAGEHCSRKCIRNPRTEVMSLLGLIVEKPPKTADFPGIFFGYTTFCY